MDLLAVVVTLGSVRVAIVVHIIGSHTGDHAHTPSGDHMWTGAPTNCTSGSHSRAQVAPMWLPPVGTGCTQAVATRRHRPSAEPIVQVAAQVVMLTCNGRSWAESVSKRRSHAGIGHAQAATSLRILGKL